MNVKNLFQFISLRRLKLQKVQTIMTVAGICLGVASIISIGIVNKSVMRSFEDSINRVTGRAALLLGQVLQPELQVLVQLEVTRPASGFNPRRKRRTSRNLSLMAEFII